MFAKILVALDDTALSSTILEQAIDMAQKFDAQLLLFHVLTSMDTNHLGLQPGGLGIEGFFPILNEQTLKQYSQEWKAYEEHGMAQLQGHMRVAADRGVAVECTQRAGDPGHSICSVAKEWDADLILMSCFWVVLATMPYTTHPARFWWCKHLWLHQRLMFLALYLNFSVRFDDGRLLPARLRKSPGQGLYWGAGSL
jgi:nucleotide-binding universal stress UspA family protein